MASAVHKNTETKAASVNVNSVCRQNTAEQGMAAPDEFMAEVQWSMAIRKMIAKLEFGDALKLLMNDRDMSVEKMESESGLSVSTVKRLRRVRRQAQNKSLPFRWHCGFRRWSAVIY